MAASGHESRSRSTSKVTDSGVPLVPLVRRLAHKGAPTIYHNLKKLLESNQQRP